MSDLNSPSPDYAWFYGAIRKYGLCTFAEGVRVKHLTNGAIAVTDGAVGAIWFKDTPIDGVAQDAEVRGFMNRCSKACTLYCKLKQ